MSDARVVEVADLDPEFGPMVRAILASLGRPFRLSAGRHRGCGLDERRGVDVHCVSATDRFRLTQLAIQYGARRIGFYPGFVHLDMGVGLPSPALWIGKRGARE